jgi:hypothetical protein
VVTTIGGVRLRDVAYDEQQVLVELDGRLGHDGEDRAGTVFATGRAQRAGGSRFGRSGATWPGGPAS